MPTLTLTSTHDTYLSLTTPTTAFGSETSFRTGVNAIGEVMHAILRFTASDFQSMSSAPTLRSSTLRFTMEFEIDQTGPFYLALLEQTAWTENATWETYDGSHEWETQGGDYTLNRAVPFAAVEGESSIEITGDDLLELCTYIVANRNSVFDLAIVWGEQAATMISIRSSEHATAASRPTLILEYTQDSVSLEKGSPDEIGGSSTLNLIEANPFTAINESSPRLLTAAEY